MARPLSYDSALDSYILTIREVADYFKLTEKTAYRLVAEGKIPGFEVGGSWRFQREKIKAWIDDQSKTHGL